ncbi:MAG TPA: hypothetical protein DCR24_02080 [Bacillus bacterium]|nr:hypothetical protein [Bacillus sp. (in: firmicutes)]
MEPTNPGNKKLPDFKELNDRLIANRAPSPQLVIKTNLDPADPTVENPYFEKDKSTDTERFKDYFEEQD